MIYEDELKKEKYDQKGSSALEDVIQYYNQHKEVLQRKYKEYCNIKVEMATFVQPCIEIGISQLLTYLNTPIVLVLTATEIEHLILLSNLKSYTNEAVQLIKVNGTIIELSYINEICLIHYNSGGTGEHKMKTAIETIESMISPNYVFLLGICYGMDYTKNHIGDVIISDFTDIYSINLRDEEKYEFKYENTEHPSRNFLKKIENLFNIIQPLGEKGLRIRVMTGGYATMNTLMSSPDAKRQLIEQMGEAKRKRTFAGEMEAGALAYSDMFDSLNGKWLLIKSICDWGENKNMLSQDKEKNEMMKDSIQAYAMYCATKSLFEIMENIVIK